MEIPLCTKPLAMITFRLQSFCWNLILQRLLENHNGQQARNLTQTDEVQQLFRHPESRIRRIYSQHTSTFTSSAEPDIMCKICSLVSDQSFYEWELVDLNASLKALKFRNELKPSTVKGLLKNRLYSINKGYLSARLRHLPSFECIRDSFKRASDEDNPFEILFAYTRCQNFSKVLNSDMARNVIHVLTNYCSKFSCDCLYSTEDGTKSIATILLYHPQFQNLNFVGEVYRGFVIKELNLSHYTEGSRIITTTFLSTSKKREVAEIFSGQGNPLAHIDDTSVLCMYKINSKNRTAIYIAEYSTFQAEQEVLILPYSSFKITNIVRNDQQRRCEIHLEEYDTAAFMKKNNS